MSCGTNAFFSTSGQSHLTSVNWDLLIQQLSFAFDRTLSIELQIIMVIIQIIYTNHYDFVFNFHKQTSCKHAFCVSTILVMTIVVFSISLECSFSLGKNRPYPMPLAVPTRWVGIPFRYEAQ